MIRKLLILSFFLVFISTLIKSQEQKFKKALYINSYAVTYSWGDSVAKGIIETFNKHPDIILYVEYLDTKRFGTKFEEDYLRLFKNKYRDIKFDVAISSDNAALEFLMENAGSLVPNVPVLFCGINNPENYNFDKTQFYGIKEGVDLDSVIHLAIRLMPNVRNLYFITDSTETSLSNLNYAKRLEPKYKGKIHFKFVNNIYVDSLYKLASHFEPESAIVLMDIFQDKDKTPVNSDLVMQKLASLSNIPIFMDSETSFGKGIVGGIMNNGVFHGKTVAKLALSFIGNPGYIPEKRVSKPDDHYYFDYEKLEKYDINPQLIPENSIVINHPVSLFRKYLFYVLAFLGVIIFLIITNSLSIFNIKKRVKVERLLKESENKLKEAQKIAKIGHWQFDHKSSLFYWSDEVYRIFEQHLASFRPIFDNFLSLIHPDDRENVKNIFNNNFTDKSEIDINFRIIAMDGQIKYVVQKFIFPEVSTSLERFLYGTIQDVTANKLIEIELDKYRNQLEALVDERTYELENTTNQLKNSFVILDNQKEKLKLTIEQLQNTREQFVQSEKLASLGVFIAGIAHEINNPINFISSGIYALFKTLDSIVAECPESSHLSKNMFRNLEIIKAAIENGIEKTTEIVSSLRNYAHPGEDKFEKYDINGIIKDVILLLNSTYKGQIEIINDSNGMLEIDCIPGKINQAIVNLTINSVQAIEGNGLISIKSVQKDNSWIEVEVADNGCGIDSINLKKIFDPFFTTKTTGKGTGLGLYIVHGIITQHNGTISVESKLGVGTTVKILLPIKQL